MKTREDKDPTFYPNKQIPKTVSGKVRKKRTQVKKWSACRLQTWTPFQRERLLKSFKQAYADAWLDGNGPSKEKVEEVSRPVVGRRETDVGRLILNACKKIQAHKHSTDRPIDKWLEMADAVSPESNDLEKQLGYVMMVASQEPMEEPSLGLDPSLPSPDYTKIYQYLLCATANKPLPPLSPVESLVVEDCMQSLAFQIQSLRDDSLRTSLRKVYLHLAKKDAYDQELDYEEIRKNILKTASVVNPLGLNAQAIVPVMPDEG